MKYIFLQEDGEPTKFAKQDYAEHGFQSRTVFKGDKYAY